MLLGFCHGYLHGSSTWVQMASAFLYLGNQQFAPLKFVVNAHFTSNYQQVYVRQGERFTLVLV